ncbi:MAG TPA: hydroxymethylpyrimidine/phosphomethylpyrimidine kinase [Steroidobacteraceae bacterium]|nr:hydroxymethylpyrimidine/phosphomethylpyrimidine kinase [Steroidobacteraceae bacterium]
MARPAVLVIAATDSSGGAGLTRDVRVLSDFSVDALCVVTAVTAQSDKKVTAVHHVPPDVIRAQIAAALATRQVGAIKIGMLGNRATVEAVIEGLRAGSAAPGVIPIVVDPVLVSTSGGVLLDAGGRAALTERLFPLATLVTPNVPEAAALLEDALATDEAGLVRQGLKLLGFGSRAILLKGGHTEGEDAVDLLIAGGRAVERIASQRVGATSRGTGCALASAIAAGLAAGKPLDGACRAAKDYVLGMLTPVS